MAMPNRNVFTPRLRVPVTLVLRVLVPAVLADEPEVDRLHLWRRPRQRQPMEPRVRQVHEVGADRVLRHHFLQMCVKIREPRQCAHVNQPIKQAGLEIQRGGARGAEVLRLRICRSMPVSA